VGGEGEAVAARAEVLLQEQLAAEKREEEEEREERAREKDSAQLEKSDVFLRRVHARRRAHVLLRAFVFMHVYTARSRQMARLLFRARATGSTCLLRQVCSAWRAHARRARLVAYWSSKIHASTSTGRLKRHLREWRQECWRRSREGFAVDALAARQCRRLLASSCSAWRQARDEGCAVNQGRLDDILFSRAMNKMSYSNAMRQWRGVVAGVKAALEWSRICKSQHDSAGLTFPPVRDEEYSVKPSY
jgi:hypothetical protein